MNLRSACWLNPVLLLSCLLAACGGGGGGGGDSTTTLAGEVQFLAVGPAIASEHAGATLDARRTTVELRAGERVLVSGFGEEGVASLRLRSSERLRVTARSVSGGARLAALDAVSMDATPLADGGSFLVRGRGDLVVRGLDSWTVELSAERARPLQPWNGSLGAFVAGDSLELVAARASTARLASAGALELSVESDGEVEVRDGLGASIGQLGPAGGRLAFSVAPLASIELASLGAARAPRRSRHRGARRRRAVVGGTREDSARPRARAEDGGRGAS